MIPTSTLLYTLPSTIHNAIIIKRPSTSIRSPYVADILLEDGTTTIAHTAALGCCGLVEKGAHVSIIPSKNKNTKCPYQIILANTPPSQTIGIHPKIAEEIAHQALQQHRFPTLIPTTIKREKTILQSRFDFLGQQHDGTYYILEVKNVPLAMERTDPHPLLPSFTTPSTPIKVAYFPDGYRKNKNDTVSTRAVKHLYNLAEIKDKEPRIRTIILFVIQREDIVAFQPSPHDPIYTQALLHAHQHGVEIFTLQVKWIQQQCHYITHTLPILL